MHKSIAAGLMILVSTSSLQAAGGSRTENVVADGGKAIGTVMLTEAPRGLLIKVEVSGLTPGWHGMHVHMVGTCADAGFKASGGHVHEMGAATSAHGLLNPQETDLGDLPNLYAGASVSMTVPIALPPSATTFAVREPPAACSEEVETRIIRPAAIDLCMMFIPQLEPVHDHDAAGCATPHVASSARGKARSGWSR